MTVVLQLHGQRLAQVLIWVSICAGTSPAKLSTPERVRWWTLLAEAAMGTVNALDALAKQELTTQTQAYASLIGAISSY